MNVRHFLASWVLGACPVRGKVAKRVPAPMFVAVLFVSLVFVPQPSSALERASLLDFARTEGTFGPGQFQDEILGWERKHVAVYWKGERYRPARSVGASGETRFHLWVDKEGRIVTDEKLNEELFGALLFLPGLTPAELSLAVKKALAKAANHREEEARYQSLAEAATAIQIASEAFSIAMSLPTEDPAAYWDYLSGSISVYNSLDLFSKLMKVYGNGKDLTEEAVREMLEEHRQGLMEDVLGKHYSRVSTGKSLAEVTSLVKKNRDLTQALRAESRLFSKFRIEADLSKARLDLKKAVSSLPWTLFTYLEDTGSVAQGAIEFTLMNRTAYLCYLKVADIYRRAAQGELHDLDELKLLSVWVPLTTELRGALLERYLKAYRGREKTISGALWWAYEKMTGQDVEVEAEVAIQMNRDLLQIERESFRRALISLEVEMNATLAALERAEGRLEPLTKKFVKTFGGRDADRGLCVQITNDGGYVIIGGTKSYGSGEEDAWLIKTDSNGNEDWNKTFGGSSSDVGASIQQTTDGGYIITGSTQPYASSGWDVWLIKTDSQGNEEWNKTYGKSSDDRGSFVLQTTDGGYIIVGESNSYGSVNADIWLIKTDSQGDTVPY